MFLIESIGPSKRWLSIQHVVCTDNVWNLFALHFRGPTTLAAHLETREEGIYVVLAGFCGSSNNTQYSKTDEVKISTGQLPSGYYPAIFEKLLFAIVYIILVPIWCFFMKSVRNTIYYRLILTLILCCCAGCVCSFISLLLSNHSGHLRAPLNLLLDALAIILRSVGGCIVLLLAYGFAWMALAHPVESESSLGSRSARLATDALDFLWFMRSPICFVCFCCLPL